MDSESVKLSFKGVRCHFVGIGGIGMSGLAKILLKNGAVVSGSDMSGSGVLDSLAKMGAKISIGHSAENITDDIEFVVISAAIRISNPEYTKADKLGLKIYKYAQMLGLVMDSYKGIAICGAHGKSTTSGWLSFLLSKAELSPNWIVGAEVSQLADSSGVGKGDAFIAEACEYDRSFLNLHPQVGVILNIEQDHLDYYKDEAEIVEAFGDFACGIAEDGVLVANGADINTQRSLEKLRKQIQNGRKARIDTFGFSDKATFSAQNISESQGLSSFDIFHNGNNLGRAKISVPGHHNVLNALAVTAAAMDCGVNKDRILEFLGEFTGVDRRLMLKAQIDGITIMDDYAHHPTEIRAALSAVRARFSPKRLICIFEPHQYSRTRFLLDDFAQSFKFADITIVPEIYFVRDTEEMKKQVNAQILVDKICSRGSKAVFIPSFNEIVEYLKVNVKKGDLVVTMGAGNIWKVADEYIQWFRSNSN